MKFLHHIALLVVVMVFFWNQETETGLFIYSVSILVIVGLVTILNTPHNNIPTRFICFRWRSFRATASRVVFGLLSSHRGGTEEDAQGKET